MSAEFYWGGEMIIRFTLFISIFFTVNAFANGWCRVDAMKHGSKISKHLGLTFCSWVIQYTNDDDIYYTFEFKKYCELPKDHPINKSDDASAWLYPIEGTPYCRAGFTTIYSEQFASCGLEGTIEERIQSCSPLWVAKKYFRPLTMISLKKGNSSIYLDQDQHIWLDGGTMREDILEWDDSISQAKAIKKCADLGKWYSFGLNLEWKLVSADIIKSMNIEDRNAWFSSNRLYVTSSKEDGVPLLYDSRLKKLVKGTVGGDRYKRLFFRCFSNTP